MKEVSVLDKTIREIFDSLKSIKSFFNDHDAKGVYGI
jgi:hypothetical protein